MKSAGDPPRINRAPAGTRRIRSGRSPQSPDDMYNALQYLLRIYQSRDRDRPCYSDISIRECHALEALLEHGPITVNDMAAVLRSDKSTASRIARALVSKGYAERTSHPSDGRAIQLAPTAAGRALENRIKGEIRDRHRRALAPFGAELRRALPAALRALADSAARPGTSENPLSDPK